MMADATMVETKNSSSEQSIELPPPGSGRVISAYLLVQATLFVGLAWKYEYFLLADEVYHRYQIEDSFFPTWLQSAEVVRYAYLGSLAAIVLGVAGMLPVLRKLFGACLVGCLAILLIHQASYNDMTFATSCWAAIWSFWFATRMDIDEPYHLMRRGAFLGRVIGSMVLLGGAVGKWTPEYWSGEVFYDIYFRERNYWVFNYLRENYAVETVREISTWYSRNVIVVETLAGAFLWLLSPRIAAAIGVILYFSIAFFSNFYLFSVLTCMAGLMAVGFFVKRFESADQS
ncbi:MAG: hypothetical protein AAF802_06030 [Planctomycetota bacterium]